MRRLLCIVTLGVVLSAPARAEHTPLDSRLIVDVGWFFLSTDTRIRVDGETSMNSGSDIDLERTFGVDDTDRFRVDALWRFANRHAVHAMYFDNNRSGTRELSRDIQFGDDFFPMGASVKAESQFTVAQLSYDYAFLQRPDYELAGGIGLHMLETELTLDATIANAGRPVDRSVSGSASTNAPLPVLGFRGLWRLSDQVYASAQAQYFYIEMDEYKGSLSDLKAQIVWQFARQVGIGVGYNNFRFRFDIDDNRHFNGRLRTGYGGALAFLSASF